MNLKPKTLNLRNQSPDVLSTTNKTPESLPVPSADHPQRGDPQNSARQKPL